MTEDDTLDAPVEMTQADRRKLIDLSKEILTEYDGKITLRQLFYRLVARHIIPNTHQAYKRVLGAMRDARVKTREIPFDAFEDKTRDFSGENERESTDPESAFIGARERYESADQTFRNAGNNYGLPLWFGQPNYVEVWCEKDALENVFLPVCDRHGVTFGTARGCASISWLYDAAERFRRVTGCDTTIQRVVVLLYTDNDPTGWQIFESIEEYLYDVFNLDSVEVRRMALTDDQIRDLEIPTDYAKSSDSRSKKWVETHGEMSAAELDAVEPRALSQMVKTHIRELWDTEAGEERSRDIEEGRQHIRAAIGDYLSKNHQ